MSETLRERVDVSDEFWAAYDSGDFDRAGKILGEDITAVSHSAAQEACDDSFMGRHVHKYATEDATVSDDSVEFDDIAWDEGRPTGTLYGRFEEYIFRGCSDFDYQGVQDFTLTFGVEGTMPGSRYIWVEVLSEAVIFSRD